MNPLMERLARGEPLTPFANGAPPKEADLAEDVAALTATVTAEADRLARAHRNHLTRTGAAGAERDLSSPPLATQEAPCCPDEAR